MYLIEKNHELQTEKAVRTSSSYTVSEIAGILRISRTKAYEMAKQRIFPVLNIGRSLRIPAELFDEWLKKQSEQL